MRPTVTDQVAWSIRLSVCLSVCHDREPGKNHWTGRHVWHIDSGGSGEASIRWGWTLTPLGEYDWIVHVRRRCGLFVKLLWPLVSILFSLQLFNVESTIVYCCRAPRKLFPLPHVLIVLWLRLVSTFERFHFNSQRLSAFSEFRTCRPNAPAVCTQCSKKNNHFVFWS